MTRRIAKWIFFSVLASVCPLFTTYMISSISRNIPWESIISRGELQLISLALLANGIGELIGAAREGISDVTVILKIVFGGFAFIGFFGCAIWFGSISSQLIQASSINPLAGMGVHSIVTFISAVVLGGSCIILSGS
jgi:hypothetical protein